MSHALRFEGRAETKLRWLRQHAPLGSPQTRLEDLKYRFRRRWTQMQAVDFDQPIAVQAGDLAERFGLRGYNAVH